MPVDQQWASSIPSLPSDRVAETIGYICGNDCSALRSALELLLELDEQNVTSDDWTTEWVSKGALKASVGLGFMRRV